jgi:hypothetical protein
MKRDYLGDSYDAVKRLWQQVLAEWAPLYAEPRFIPEDLRADFTRLTGIPMLHDAPPGPYSILNDPDTGIRLPDEHNQTQSRKHIALTTICEQLRLGAARSVITFDQSTYRLREHKPDRQRQTKMRYLAKTGLFAFYYVSHAPFLFTFPSEDARRQLWQSLLSFGIPGARLETHS